MKVEIGGFVTPNITVSANSRIIFDTGRKAEGEQSDSLKCCLLRQPAFA